MTSYEGRIIKKGNNDYVCELYFNDILLDVNFPKSVIEDAKLDLYDNFKWNIPTDGSVNASDLEKMEPHNLVTIKEINEFIKLLEEAE